MYGKEYTPEILPIFCIKLEYNESFCFCDQAFYFDRYDVALPGFSRFFKKASDRELENADFLMTYVNKRGGYIRLEDIDVRMAPELKKSLLLGISAYFDI